MIPNLADVHCVSKVESQQHQKLESSPTEESFFTEQYGMHWYKYMLYTIVYVSLKSSMCMVGEATVTIPHFKDYMTSQIIISTTVILFSFSSSKTMVS